MARREASSVQRRLKTAHFPTEATWEAFDFSYNAKLPQAQIRDLAGSSSSRPARGSSVTARSVSARATSLVHWGTLPAGGATTSCSPPPAGWLAELAGGHADRSFEVRLKKLSKVELLIVDDFAMRELTAAQADDFYELVSERIGRPGRSPC